MPKTQLAVIRMLCTFYILRPVAEEWWCWDGCPFPFFLFLPHHQPLCYWSGAVCDACNVLLIISQLATHGSQAVGVRVICSQTHLWICTAPPTWVPAVRTGSVISPPKTPTTDCFGWCDYLYQGSEFLSWSCYRTKLSFTIEVWLQSAGIN